MSQRPAFSARAVVTWKADRLYRVFPDRARLVFARIGGQSGWAEGFEANGLGFIGTWLRRREADRTARALAVVEAAPLDEQLAAHRHNFELRPEDVVSSRIDPPPRIGAHGVHAARWVVERHAEGRLLLQLETVGDAQAAVALLPPVLGSRLELAVAWDGARCVFVAHPDSL